MRELDQLHEKLLTNEGYRRAFAEEDLIHRIAERVLWFRRKRNLTQVQLAKGSGFRQPRIAEIEAGDVNMQLRTLARLAYALGCRSEDLVTRTVANFRYEDLPQQEPARSFTVPLDWLSEAWAPITAANDNFSEAA